jgi:hypothetical protein
LNLSKLTKQQKEHLLLAVMGVVTTIAVLQNLVIGPKRAQAQTARETIAKLSSDVRSGESLLNRDRLNVRTLNTISAEILEIMQRDAPPDFSRYTWALGRLSRIARQHDIFPQIREFGGGRYIPHRGAYAEIRNKSGMWSLYTVEINFSAGYSQTMEFLDSLYREEPLAGVGQLTIQADPDNPMRHRVNMLVEWPVFRHAEDKAFLIAAGGDAQ